MKMTMGIWRTFLAGCSVEPKNILSVIRKNISACLNILDLFRLSLFLLLMFPSLRVEVMSGEN